MLDKLKEDFLCLLETNLKGRPSQGISCRKHAFSRSSFWPNLTVNEAAKRSTRLDRIWTEYKLRGDCYFRSIIPATRRE